jgi:hypothetical protein
MSSPVLKIGYVPEHFSYVACSSLLTFISSVTVDTSVRATSSPLLQLAAVDGGKTFTLVSCPAGTGQMIQRLTDGEIDVSMWVERASEWSSRAFLLG